MPSVFHRNGVAWLSELITSPRGLLHLAPVRFTPDSVTPDTERPAPQNGLTLQRIDGERKWAALAANGLQLAHNGQPVPAGLRILAHRDSLAIGNSEPVFFSTEEAPQVETFAGVDPVSCPRCRGDIELGNAVVRCPDCGVMHHEAADRNCWTYAENCALCSQPTAFDAGLRWTPEGL